MFISLFARVARTGAMVCFVLVAVSASSLAADQVTFSTDFGLYGRHAYYYVGIEKGYYARENIDLNIVRSSGSAATIKQVANGTAQLGFADAFAVVLGRANDDIPVKLVAMIYPKPPHAIYVLKNSGITTPKDFEGKSLADTAFSSMPKLFPIYARAAGIDASKVKWVAAHSDALPGMLAFGQVAGVGQFTVGEPLLAAAAAPKEIIGFPYSQVGLDYYSNGIVCSDDLISSNPDLIRRFVRATLAALKDAIANPVEAGAIMHKYHRGITAEVAAAETAKVAELAVQPDAPLGAIDPGRVQKTIDIAAEAYELKSKVTPADLYAPGFVPK